VSELNKEMTKIQVLQVGGAKSNEQIASLALQYNGLAKELGATTLEVTKGSVEWLRQGKTIEQTQTLLQSTLMASKLGNMESAQATEYLTAILNGFQMQAEEATSIVDRLIAIDNNSATSFQELATAMQYSSAIANQAGVSFDNLAAYIATVSSRTRLTNL
jgi:TP901 family phage tail tape measure protein